MKKNILALLFGIGMVIFLIAIAEIVLYHLNEENLILRENDPPNSLYSSDETFGYKPRYNTVIRDHMYLKNGLELYDVEYSIDSIGRRITPRVCNDSIAVQDVLFFGGSYTFGAGVNDDETLPYYLSKFAPEYRAFNYGFCGYGPQQMLELLMRDDIASGVDGEDPTFVYPFIDCHLLRLVGSMRRHAI